MIAVPRSNHQSSTVSVWFALLGGHVAWTLHLLVGYFLVSLSCLPGLRFRLFELNGFLLLIWLLTLATAVLACAATVTGWRDWRQEGTSWRGFVALTGMLLSGLFCATIVLQGVPLFFLAPCPLQE
jgi:hypothetical protein